MKKDWTRGARFLLFVAIALLSTMLLGPPGAGASERVQDGNFEAATCDASDCTSPFWSESAFGSVATPLGLPICHAGTGSCGDAQGGIVGYHGPTTWVQMGGPAISNALDFNATNTFSVQQTVQIPAPPATLRFYLLIRPGPDAPPSPGDLFVQVDGTPVFQASYTTAGYGTYAPVSVDVGGFAGGSRILRFEATVKNVYTSSRKTTSFNVDDVSLDAADAPAASPTAPAASPTGQRAAALKKCKKKKLQKARKKCKRKANLLPV
jgi:hypothetical protein